MKSSLNWFEIPLADFDRGKKFYSEILGEELPVIPMEGAQMAMLPQEGHGVGGALIKHADVKPSDNGTCVYLNGGEDLQGMLDKVEPAGGKIVIPKTIISEEHGYFALFVDTEGNKVGLHSMK